MMNKIQVMISIFLVLMMTQQSYGGRFISFLDECEGVSCRKFTTALKGGNFCKVHFIKFHNKIYIQKLKFKFETKNLRYSSQFIFFLFYVMAGTCYAVCDNCNNNCCKQVGACRYCYPTFKGIQKVPEENCFKKRERLYRKRNLVSF